MSNDDLKAPAPPNTPVPSDQGGTSATANNTRVDHGNSDTGSNAAASGVSQTNQGASSTTANGNTDHGRVEADESTSNQDPGHQIDPSAANQYMEPMTDEFIEMWYKNNPKPGK